MSAVLSHYFASIISFNLTTSNNNGERIDSLFSCCLFMPSMNALSNYFVNLIKHKKGSLASFFLKHFDVRPGVRLVVKGQWELVPIFWTSLCQ